MSSPKKWLAIAAKLARSKNDGRCFYFGAVAIRSDDILVFAYNGAPKYPCHQHHCEARLARKLDRGAEVYLVRTTSDGAWANSKPCAYCHNILRKSRVTKVYYTTGPNEWNVLTF